MEQVGGRLKLQVHMWEALVGWEGQGLETVPPWSQAPLPLSQRGHVILSVTHPIRAVETCKLLRVGGGLLGLGGRAHGWGL